MADKLLTIQNFNNTIIEDYYRQYLFTVRIVSKDASEKFEGQWVANTQTPIVNIGIQNIDFLHTQIKQSGRTTVPQWAVSIRDDSINKAFNFFHNWRNKVYNFEKLQTATIPNRYKYNADITLISPVMVSVFQRQYTLVGLWPMEVGAITLDYNSNEISTFPVTFALDYYTVNTHANL